MSDKTPMMPSPAARCSASSAGFARAIRFGGRFGRGAEPPSEGTAAHGDVVAHGAGRSEPC